MLSTISDKLTLFKQIWKYLFKNLPLPPTSLVTLCSKSMHNKNTKSLLRTMQFSIPQIQYPIGGSSKRCIHVYVLLIVAMVLLLWCQNVPLWHQVTMVASEQYLYQIIVQFDKTIILHRKLATGSIYDYIFCHCPLVGILLEVLRIKYLDCPFYKRCGWHTMDKETGRCCKALETWRSG